MKIIVTLIILFQFFTSTFAQENSDLTAEEKAYLFHVVRKSPILENNFGRYFEYKGPDIRFPNKEINFDIYQKLIKNYLYKESMSNLKII